MSKALETFFDAWSMSDTGQHSAAIAEACAAEATYADPRTPDTLQGPDAIAAYIAMFTANAPGWSARVIKSDVIASTTRATIAFGGPGPDGSDITQHGQYFVEFDGDLITRMIGFAGTGEPAQ